MLALGMQCAICNATKKLVFDCKVPLGDTHHKWESSRRMSFYRLQHRIGNLQVLCSKCNEAKAREERHLAYLSEMEVECDPF